MSLWNKQDIEDITFNALKTRKIKCANIDCFLYALDVSRHIVLSRLENTLKNARTTEKKEFWKSEIDNIKKMRFNRCKKYLSRLRNI